MTDVRDPNQAAMDSGTPPPQQTAPQPGQSPALNTQTNPAQPTQPGQPNAAQPAQAQPSATASNRRDATTQAGASIPPALVNNPAVPSQRMAFDADANKNSPAPHHSWINAAAEALAGGPRYQYQVDEAGNMIRTKVPVSTAHLGLAIALEALKGAAAGGGQHGPGATGRAAAAGLQQGESDQAKLQQQDQQAQQNATAASDHKQKVTEANLRNYQLAQNVGTQSREVSQALPDAYKPITEAMDNGTISLPGIQRMFESDAAASVKNGDTNVTSSLLIPYGDAQPLMEGGQQKVVNGVPVWGHNYMVIPNAASAQVTLTDQMQKAGQKLGMFTKPDGSPADIGQPQWSLADLAQKMSKIAEVNTGEQLLQLHKNDAHDMLGRPSQDLGSLSDAVRKDPNMQKAVAQFSKYAGVGSIDTILGTMNKQDPNSASLLMQYLNLTPKDMEDMQNVRDKNHAAAVAEAKAEAKPEMTPEQKAHLQAQTEQALSTVAKNRADVDKIHADIDKKLKDDSTHSSIVDSFGTGHVSAANMAYILRSKEGQALLADVTSKYPDFDSSKAGAYPKVYDEFTSTKKGTAGGAINNGATAFKHLQELLNLNTNLSHVPGTPAYVRYKNQVDTLADELGQFYGNTTIPGLADLKSTLDSTLPGNREAAIRTQAHSMGEKMDSYVQQWRNAAPSKAYEAPLPFYDDAAKNARAALTGQPAGAQGRAAAPVVGDVKQYGGANYQFDGTQWKKQ